MQVFGQAVQRALGHGARQERGRHGGEVAPRLGPEGLAALGRSVEACLEPGADAEAARQAEIAFHPILARRCGNPPMGFVARLVVDPMSEMTITRNIVDPGGERFHEGNPAAHRALLDAFAAGDAERGGRRRARRATPSAPSA